MSGYLPIQFIEGKIKNLENALFFSMSDAVLKIPTCVVKILETDDLGQIWFMIPRPSQFIHTFEKTFPVKLDFFRKGHDYYVKIFGKAFLVNDPEEINSTECLSEQTKQQTRKNESVLIKVQITHAEYVEKTPAKPNTKALLTQVKNKLYRWFQLMQPDHQMPEYQKIPSDIRYPSISSYTN